MSCVICEHVKKQNDGFLAELEAFAHQENIPIIQHEVVAYFRFLLQTLQPKNILEIGTAIGFSALLMAENAPEAKITTLDRNPEMIAFAKENFAKYDTRKQITLVEAMLLILFQPLKVSMTLSSWILQNQNTSSFCQKFLKHLKVGGVVIFDDVFQGGDIVKPIEEVRRGQRTIYRGLQRLFDATLDNPNLTASLLPLSDGLLMLCKNAEDVEL